MDRVYSFVQAMCKEYNIDESHDVTHARDCVQFARAITDTDCSAEERTMIEYAAALHDCVDKKYVDVHRAKSQVYTFLYIEEWEQEDIVALIKIITTMSYSWLKSQMVEGRQVWPDHGPYQRAYHTVRQADLLCSYRAERCYQYQKRLSPAISEDDCWDKVRDLFLNRVFCYIRDRWLESPKAILLTPLLIAKARSVLGLK